MSQRKKISLKFIIEAWRASKVEYKFDLAGLSQNRVQIKNLSV